MIPTLFHLLRSGNATQRELFPDLPGYSRGLPRVTQAPCAIGDGCSACVDACPTEAITAIDIREGKIALDLGRCIGCGECTKICPTGTIVEDRSTRVARRRREDLIQTNAHTQDDQEERRPADPMFRRSIHIREVSTGDNASDLEVAAANNPIFDASRFGVHFVASPRFADALLVTGPVARAMQEPLRRCYDAMAEPRLVIAVGASAISGGPHRESYAQAEGVGSVLPVSVYVPGSPPHPWYILHGILLAMGRSVDTDSQTDDNRA